MGVEDRVPAEVGMEGRPRVFPLVAAPTGGPQLGGVGNREALPAGVGMDLQVGDPDPSTRQGPPHFCGSPRRAAVFPLDLALLLLGQGRTRRSATRVETGHDARQAPPLKQFPQPGWADSPAIGQQTDLLDKASPPQRLEDQPLDPTVGQPRHERYGRGGAGSLPPPRPPPSTGGQATRHPARTRN